MMSSQCPPTSAADPRLPSLADIRRVMSEQSRSSTENLMQQMLCRLFALFLVTLTPVTARSADLPGINHLGFGDFRIGSSWVEAASSNGGTTLSSILMGYSFRVNGPAATTVPLDLDYLFQGELTFTGSGPQVVGSGIQQISVGFLGGRQTFFDQASIGGNSVDGRVATPGEGPGHAEFSVSSNAIYTITLLANASVSSVAGPTGVVGHLRSYTDPYLSIDSSFGASHPDYALEFSAGIENIAAVPEPRSFAMMMAGLLVLVLATPRGRNALQSEVQASTFGGRLTIDMFRHLTFQMRL